MLTPYEQGNGASTVSFIEYLQILHQDKKLLIIGDGASYHGSQEVQTYLNKVNPGLEEQDWQVTCLLFAPNAPDQNPVEAGWLQGKNFLRRHFFKNKTFQQVNCSFFNFLNKKVFMSYQGVGW